MDLSLRVWMAYVVLLAAAIPWYWRFMPVSLDLLVCGVPCWVASSVFFSALISAFTGYLLARPWPEEREEREADG